MTILGISFNMVVFWLVLAVIFLVIEIITIGLTTIWFAAGSLVSLVLAMFDVHVGIQFVVFLAVSFCLLLFTRKIFVEKLNTGSERTNSDALIGEIGQVTTTIKPLEFGQVHIKGQAWSAISKTEEIIEKDQHVKVIAIEGVKLIVVPENEK